MFNHPYSFSLKFQTDFPEFKNSLNKPRNNRFILNWTDLIFDRLTNESVKECRDEERLNTTRLYWFTQMNYIQSHLIQGKIH